ncbi:MAG: hypothetical protein ABMB14_30325 [Myxococcota bacterium]
MARLRNLGAAFLALGMIELAWVAFCFGGAALLGIGVLLPDEGKLLLVGSAAYVILALVNLPIALIHLLAGAKLRQGTATLLLALAAFAASLVSMVLALYCSPFTLAVLVYAVVVLADPDAREALDPAPRR